MTSKIGEKQAAAMASLDQFCGVFSLFFWLFLLIFFLILGVEKICFFHMIFVLKKSKNIIDLSTPQNQDN